MAVTGQSWLTSNIIPPRGALCTPGKACNLICALDSRKGHEICIYVLVYMKEHKKLATEPVRLKRPHSFKVTKNKLDCAVLVQHFTDEICNAFSWYILDKGPLNIDSRSTWQQVKTSSCYGLVPNTWPVITWTNDDSVHWRHMVLLNQSD